MAPLEDLTVDTSRPVGDIVREIVSRFLARDLAQEAKITACDQTRAAAVAIIEEANRTLGQAETPAPKR